MKKEAIYPHHQNCRICDLYFKKDADNYKYLCKGCREYLEDNEEEDSRSAEVQAARLAEGRTKPVYYD